MNYFHLYVALGSILVISLAFNVSRIRMRERIAHGDGSNRSLKSAIRAHMINFEHIIPFALILFVLSEMGSTQELMAFLSLGFLLTRLIHSYGMLAPHYISFRVSSALTYFFEIFGSVTILIKLFTQGT
jgi:uncharacterized membrane protein YecN with MAPEG domain